MVDDLKQFADEIKRHFDVAAESLRSEIRQVAEGLIGLDDKTERGFAEVRREFDEVKAMTSLRALRPLVMQTAQSSSNLGVRRTPRCRAAPRPVCFCASIHPMPSCCFP